MKGGFTILSQPQLKATIRRMEETEKAATAVGDHKLAFSIQQKIVDLAFVLHPEWDKRPVRVASNGKRVRVAKVEEPEQEEPEVPRETLEEVRGLSDEELARSLGR